MDFETAQQAIITKAQAIAEIKRHGVDPVDFFNEVGTKTHYKGSDVLWWLGY